MNKVNDNESETESTLELISSTRPRKRGTTSTQCYATLIFGVFQRFFCKTTAEPMLEMKQDSNESNWSNLQPELLESISGHLPLLDCLTFGEVCKNWRSVVVNYSKLAKFSTDPMLLIYQFDEHNNNNINDTCYLYDCRQHVECCTIRLPLLCGATCLDSRAGWLLARQNNHIFFYHILSATKIDLPLYPGQPFDEDTFCTFSSLPSERKCIVIVLHAVNSSTFEIGSCNFMKYSKWEVREIDLDGESLGELKSIYCCDCYGNGECDCELRGKVEINGSNSCFTYDYKIVEGSTKKSAKRYGNVTWLRSAIIEQFKKFHGDDLMEKFGRAGICLSLCSYEKTTKDKVLVVPSTLTCSTGDHETLGNVKIIEGALIKPIWQGQLFDWPYFNHDDNKWM